MVFTIVITFNGSKWLKKCFESLINSSIQEHSIIAIDNGSTDDTLELIRHYFPMIKIFETKQNLGFGKANNIGIKEAYNSGADYIFLLNQDAWVEEDTIEKLVNAHLKEPEYGVLSPIHLNGDGTSLDYGFLNYINRDKSISLNPNKLIKTKDGIDKIYKIDFVNAAFWLLPRKTIEIVGGFNPFFFHYGEDRDFVNRCHFFNLKVGIVPSVKAYHDRIQHDSISKLNVLSRNSLLIKFFDPKHSIKVKDHIKDLTLTFIKNLLRFQLHEAKANYHEIRYYNLHKNEIDEISKKLTFAGLTFLD